MEITDSYRKSRRNVTLLSCISIAWAAAQFEVSAVKTSFLGDLSVSKYSIPVILGFAVLFSMTRCTIEYMMQEKKVRRWSLAKFDYGITLILAYISIPALAAAGLSRSLKVILITFGISIALFISYLLFTLIFMMILMPFVMLYRHKTKAHPSVATEVAIAERISSFTSAILLVVSVCYFGSSLFSHGYKTFGLNEKPNHIAITIFIIVSVLSTIFALKYHSFLQKVYAFEPPYIVKKEPLEDGTIGISFEKNKNA